VPCRLVDEIVWVKMTVNRRLAKSHGYYLQHAKEVCLVGKKGKEPVGLKVRPRTSYKAKPEAA
jgi:mRNA (2'-O-methyladenosine-N6-)-methyltransferase